MGSTTIYRPIELKDTNGNYITIAYQSAHQDYGKLAISTITDTLGRTITFGYDANYRLTSISAPDITSGTRTVATFVWGTTNLTYNFTLDVEDTQTSPSSINVLTECKYANDTKYLFTYGDWGIVKQIDFKSATGATRSSVSYNYPTTSTALSDHPTYTIQTVNDGVSGQWTTSVTKTSGLVSAYAITAPNGTKTTTNLYTSGWNTGLVSSVVVSSGSTTLRTSANTWVNSSDGPRVTAVTTTLNDSGQQSKVEFVYTTHGNVSEVKEYDWGPSLFRKSQTDYETGSSYVSNHILDRPKQVRIYDSGNNLKARMDFAYDAGSLTNITGAAHHDDTNYGSSFATRGNLTAIVRYPNLPSTSGSITRNFTYDTLGNLRTADVDCCQQEQWTFGSANQYAYPTSIVRGPSGLQLTTNLTYDTNTGLLLTEEDPNGQDTNYTYNDSMLRLTAITGALSTSTTYSFDDGSAQFKSTATTSIDATTSVVTVTTTDGTGRPIKREPKNSGGSTTFSIVETEYDNMGRVKKVSNPYTTGTVLWTETQYDTLSRPIKVIPPDGTATANNTQFTYSGNATTITDPAGKQRRTYTDALGRLVQAHEPGYSDGSAGSGSVFISGQERSVCSGWVFMTCILWVYDFGSVWITVNGFTVTAAYDQNSTAASIASGLASQFNSSSGSPVTASVTGSNVTLTAKTTGLHTNYAVSAGGASSIQGTFPGTSFNATPSGSQLTGGADGTGANGQPATLNTPLITVSTYDVFDNLLVVTQGVQQRTFTYDSLGRLKTATTPEAGTVSYTYNSFSLLTGMTDARGVDVTYTYDNLNRLKTVSYDVSGTTAAATSALQYFYDEVAGGAFALGRLTRITQGGVDDEKYVYDALGRVTQLTKKISGTNYVVGYAYNRLGAITQITYPSTRQVTHSFDAIGRLTQVASGGVNYVSGVTYNAAHAPTAYSYGNGVAAAIGYNSRFQLASLAYTKSSTKLLELAYAYTGHANGGNNGQITGITDSTGTQEAGRTVSYTYDAWARLKTAATTGSTTYPAWGLSWTYDRFGNRKQQTVTAGSGPSNLVTVSATNNRVTAMGAASFDYDASGNLTKDDLRRYVYDANGKQVKLRNLANTADVAEYVLDSAGMRVKKCTPNCTSPTARTVYVLALAEYDNGAAVASPTREYILSGGALVATIEGSSTKYHHSDHLSRRVTTNTAGNLLTQQGHYPFGEQWYAKDASGANVSPGKLFFTSYERDGESGNDYAIFRTHMNRTGRFTSPDPIAGSMLDPQSLNRYTYTRNDPVNLVDPLGLEWICSQWWGSFWVSEDGELDFIEGSEYCGGGWVWVEFRDAPIAEVQDSDGGGGQGALSNDADKKKDLINAALREENLSKCLNEFFGPGTILTNHNLPRIDASQHLRGGRFGQTDAKQVPDKGRPTVQIDRGLFTGLPANDPQLIGTYLHETGNALAIQRFTNVQPRGARMLLGPRGRPATDAQSGKFDPDIGEQFEECIFRKE